MSENLKLALEETLDEVFFEPAEEHVFSKKFDRRMKKLTRLGNTPKPRFSQKTVRLLVIAVLLAAAAICGFITTNVLYHVDNTAENFGFTIVKAELGANAPKTIQHYYELAPPPGFYKLSEEVCTEQMYEVNYTDGNVFYQYYQYTQDGFFIGFEKESTVIEYGVSGELDARMTAEGALIATHIWSDGTYIYQLSGRIEGFDFGRLDSMTEVFPEYKTPDYGA